MKIEDLIRLSENAIFAYISDTKAHKVHIDSESENEIHSWYNEQDNLVERELIYKSGNGFGIYLGADGFLWFRLIENYSISSKNKIAIGIWKKS